MIQDSMERAKVTRDATGYSGDSSFNDPGVFWIKPCTSTATDYTQSQLETLQPQDREDFRFTKNCLPTGIEARGAILHTVHHLRYGIPRSHRVRFFLASILDRLLVTALTWRKIEQVGCKKSYCSCERSTYAWFRSKLLAAEEAPLMQGCVLCSGSTSRQHRRQEQFWA